MSISKRAAKWMIALGFFGYVCCLGSAIHFGSQYKSSDQDNFPGYAKLEEKQRDSLYYGQGCLAGSIPFAVIAVCGGAAYGNRIREETGEKRK